MKGKIEIRFCAPNVARLRQRVVEPSNNLTAELRDLIKESVVKVLNANQVALKATIIEGIAKKGLQYTNENHKLQVMNLMGSIFDTQFATSAEGINNLLSADLSACSCQDESKCDCEPTTVSAADEFDE